MNEAGNIDYLYAMFCCAGTFCGLSVEMLGDYLKKQNENKVVIIDITRVLLYSGGTSTLFGKQLLFYDTLFLNNKIENSLQFSILLFLIAGGITAFINHKLNNK